MRTIATVLVALTLASAAQGQSFNVDFGGPASTPPASYAGVGLPGVWNAVGVLPPGQRQPLVDLSGQPSVAQVYMIGGTQLLEVDDPLTSGDDGTLLDDMLIGYNDPVDVCLWVENLQNGDYEVISYALTPGEATRVSPVRVDFGSPGIVNVGGSWPGFHEETISYSRHTVTITNGRVGFHSGTPSGFFQSGMNGFQIRPLATTAVTPGSARGAAITGVFPNPGAGSQRIALDLGPIGPWTVEVLDVAGRLVWRRDLAVMGGAQTLEWDGRDLRGNSVPNGLYLARIVRPGQLAPRAGLHKIVRAD
jgi:hypothetical protein